jgi:hypothetical protein
MNEVALSQNFRINPFDSSNMFQTSLGPVILQFADTEPDGPPSVNMFAGAMWFEPRELQAGSEIEIHQMLEFKEESWHLVMPLKYRVDNVEKEIPAAVQSEIVDLVAAFARENQERFVKRERARFYDWVRITAEMLDECKSQLPTELAMEELLESHWTAVVTPRAVKLAEKAKAAGVRLDDAIRELTACCQAIAELNEGEV